MPVSQAQLSATPRSVAPAELEELGIDLTPLQQQRIADITAILHTGDFYELLGIERAADRKTIKRAFHARVKEFHPDRFFRKRLGSFRSKLDAIIERCTEAHDTLCNAAMRARHDATLIVEQPSAFELMLEESLAEMDGAAEASRREHVELDELVGVESDLSPQSRRSR